jgi:SAM-dependent methyltransferase
MIASCGSAGEMGPFTYNPDVFSTPDEEAARRIILTSEGGMDTDARWNRETPYLADLIGGLLTPRPGAVLVDYGCGIGRLAKALIERFDCKVIGIDISAEMRRMAVDYVGSPNFHAHSVGALVEWASRGHRANAAYSVWVLQHCVRPDQDIAKIAGALQQGGLVAVVNNKERAVPTVEHRWVDDGLDIGDLLAERFDRVSGGDLDPAIVGEQIAAHTFWGCYRQRSSMSQP